MPTLPNVCEPVWVVIPCFSSPESLIEVVSEVHEVLGGLTQFAGVLLVIDGPDDRTEDIAQRAISPFPCDKLLVLARNVGQHAATLAGIAAAGEALVLTVDDDGQNDPREGRTMLEMLISQKVDVVYGMSSGSEHARWRNYLSRRAKHLVARISGPSVRHISSFRALRSGTLLRAYPTVPAQPNLDALLFWSTSRIDVFAVQGRDRVKGKSTYGLKRLVSYGWSLVTTFSNVPLRIITYLGLVSALTSVVLLVYFLVSYIQDQRPLSGFTAIATMITTFSAVQFIALGVIGEYLSRVHAASLWQPPYVVERVQNGQGARTDRWEVGS